MFDVTVCRCDDSDDEVVYFDGAAKAGGECRSANDTCMDWCYSKNVQRPVQSCRGPAPTVVAIDVLIQNNILFK